VRQTSSAAGESPKPWYREPWPWLLMLGPMLVIVAGGVTLWLAVSSSDGLVADDYYRQGLLINRAIEKEQRAGALGVGLALRLEDGGRRLVVELSGGPAVEGLAVRLTHPTRAGHDVHLLLAREAPGVYAGGLPEPLAGRWNVQVDGADWRLAGAWDTAAQAQLALGRAR
jgi:hypothetical protein